MERAVASIDELADTDTRREHLLANLGYQLMAGTAVEAGWIQLAKNNVAAGAADDAIYNTDWVLTCDGAPIGYLDTEEKREWSDVWPYPFVNVAKHPMSHWKRGRFSGRLTNKLLSFQQLPAASWWVGVRKDWQHAVLVNAADLFAYGREVTINTKFSDVPLPVLRIPNSKAFLARDADEFTRTILNRIRSNHAIR